MADFWIRSSAKAAAFSSRWCTYEVDKVNPWGAVTVEMEGGGGWEGSVMSNHLIDKILYQSLMVKNKMLRN